MQSPMWPQSVSSLIAFAARSLLGAFCLMALAVACVGRWRAASDAGGNHGSLVLAALLACSAIFLSLRSQKLPAETAATAERSWTVAGFGMLGALALSALGLAYRYGSNQPSDFGTYYRCGTEIPSTLAAWVQSCQSHFFYHRELTYWSRSLAYSAPLGWLGIGSYPVLKFYNAALQILTLALLFFGLKKRCGARTATTALLLFGLYPERFYTTVLATPDNIAMLWIIGFLLVVPKLPALPNGWTRWALAAALAGLMFALHLARTIGPILVASLLLAALLSSADRSRLWRWLPLLAVALGLYTGLNALLKHAIPVQIHDQFSLLPRLSAIDFSAPLQDYRQVFAWIDQFLPAVPDSERSSVVLKKILLEFCNGFSHAPAFFQEKLKVLFSGDGYYGFSTFNFGPNPDSIATLRGPTPPTSPLLPPLFSALIFFQLILAGVAIVRRCGSEFDGLFDCALAFLAMFFVVIALGDTQARYSLLAAPALAIVAAHGLAPLPARPVPKSFASGSAVLGLVPALLAIVVSAGWLGLLWARHSPSPLASFAQAPGRVMNGQKCNEVPLQISSDYKHLRVMPIAGAACSVFTLTLPAGSQSASFFVAADRFALPFEPHPVAPTSFQVLSGQESLLKDTLGQRTVAWYKLALASAQAAPVLTFVLWNLDAQAAPAPFNLWVMQRR